jgi:2-keto-3-deoxy-L-rhamnonate aldolase RhmA
MSGPGAKLGGWAASSDPIVVERLARSGFDFIGLDLQHGQFGLTEAFRALQVLSLLGTESYVRMPALELATLPRYLDFGATGIVLANVDDAATAARAVELSRFQPDGQRSFAGARFELVEHPVDVATVRPPIWAMIETRSGLEQCEAIAAVPGLAGLAIGPADLARALGLPVGERFADAAWNDAVDRILAVARDAGIGAWQFAADGVEARRWIERGFDHVVLSNDLNLLARAARTELEVARSRSD